MVVDLERWRVETGSSGTIARPGPATLTLPPRTSGSSRDVETLRAIRPDPPADPRDDGPARDEPWSVKELRRPRRPPDPPLPPRRAAARARPHPAGRAADRVRDHRDPVPRRRQLRSSSTARCSRRTPASRRRSCTTSCRRSSTGLARRSSRDPRGGDRHPRGCPPGAEAAPFEGPRATPRGPCREAARTAPRA